MQLYNKRTPTLPPTLPSTQNGKGLSFVFLTGILILLIQSPYKAAAQDPHFSQFYASPLTLNPAFAGKFEGNMRAATNFRSQWNTVQNAYRTATVAVDLPILTNTVNERDLLGVGLMAYTDKAANGAVNFNYASFTTDFHKGLDDNGYHQIGVGLQGTYANMLIKTALLQFADQLTEFGFTNPSSESFSGSNLSNHYFDLSAGALYTGSSAPDNNFYIGVSGYHLNNPRQHFTEGDYNIAPRYTFHGGGYFPTGDISSLHLSALHSIQAGAQETVVGGIVQFALANENKAAPECNFYAGSFIRFKDAIIPYIGLDFYDFKLGLSFDITSSKAKTATQSRSGMELSLAYIFKNREKGYIPCPKF